MQLKGGTKSAASNAFWDRRQFIPLLGLFLVGLNLRADISALPPIYSRVAQDFPFSPTSQSLMGTLPLIAYAVFGVVSRNLISQVGIERSLITAMLFIFGGDLLRSTLSESIYPFAIFSFICFGGMGIANVALPPMIKKYFPNRIGPMTSFYIVLTVFSASLPPLVAVPMTNEFGWRFSVGIWSFLGLAAVVPWYWLARLAKNEDQNLQGKNTSRVSLAVWRWPTAWAIATIFGVGAFNMFAVIAWLPKMLTISAGISAVSAGAILSLYNFIGLSHSLLLPTLPTKMRKPIWAIMFATACGFIGPIGLALAPSHYWIWIFPTGLGAMTIPIGLVLINLRSRTPEGAAALSSFVQGVGYLFGAFGPLTVGLLATQTGAWVMPNIYMGAIALLPLLAGIAATRAVFVEDAMAIGKV